MDLLPNDHIRTATPFSGWALQKAAAADISRSRGLVADIAPASILKRQAAFAVLASIEIDDPQPFLSRVGVPDGTVGDAIRTCRARDLIAAGFDAEAVPTGYLRGLVRIGEKPLSEPRLYRRLFDILSNPTEALKAHALRYCGDLNAIRIQAVDWLDAVLIHPEIVKGIHSPEHARRANLLMRFLRETCSTATDEALAAGLRQSIESEGLDGFARRFLRRADRFPPAPLRSDPDVVPLSSAAALVEMGKRMGNCLGNRIAETLLGFNYYYITHIAVGGRFMPVAIELSPMSSGQWKVESVQGPKNRPIPVPQRKTLIHRLQRMGALVEINPGLHPEAKALVEPLNVHRWNQLLPLEDGSDDPPDEVVEIALREIEREFGLV